MLLAFEHAERETDPVRREPLLTFVVIGGGPTGVEMAGALAEISRQSLARDFRHFDPSSARVILLEAGPHVLSTFPEPLREAARADLVRLGVSVRTGAAVTNVASGRVEIGTEVIAAETVIWAAGVAASPLGATLGVPLDRAGRVLVEPDLTVPGSRTVFVIGDLASLTGVDGRPLPGVAQVAIQMGKHAARNVMRAIEQQPYQPFIYKDLGNMATIGRASAVADFGWLRLKGYIGWLAWLFVHILNLIGFRNRLVVMVQWAWSYFSYQRAIRLITGPLPDLMAIRAHRRLESVYDDNLRVTLIAAALVAAIVPLPSRLVEAWYSRRFYPAIQGVVTPLSNLVPVALLDIAVLVLLVVLAIVFWRRVRASGIRRALISSALSLVTLAAVVFLLFLAIWGLNYRRLPLDQKLEYDQRRVTREAAIRLGSHAVREVNALHAAGA